MLDTDAAGQTLICFHRIAVLRVDEIGRAELGGELKLGRIDIDRENAPRTCDRRAVDRSHADAAALDHAHGLARTDLGRVHHRAEAGDDAAADRSAARSSGILRIFTIAFVHEHLLAEGGEVEELIQLLAPAEEGDAWHQLDVGAGAEHGVLAGAAHVAGAVEYRTGR